MERIRKKEFVPILLLNETDMPVEYCFFPVLQYGNALRSVQMPDFSLLIEKYFSSRDHSDRIRQRASDLFKLIHNTRSKLEKKIVLQEAELSEAGQKEEYKTYGDLITYNMYLVKRGMTSADLIDYNTEDLHSVSVPLDARLSPAANAQRYYKKYSKAKKAEVELTHQLSLSRSEIAYLDSVADNLLRANGQTELDEIRSELAEAGYGAKLKRNGGGAKKTVSKPLSFRTSGGYRVLCGKNNLQNEQLTLKTASKNDWWFHVKDAPGSHVILFTEGKEPSEQDFTEAASIAAVYSSLSQAKNIPVDYTQVRNIKKPTGSRPGFVVYPTHYSAYVSPSPDAVREMLEK
jgi:predicted ribosome quality control (RQC) complex YloA/Tae2 family protein